MHALLTRLKSYNAAQDDLSGLAESAIFTLHSEERGVILIETGAPLDHVFVVASGWAIRHRTLEDGRRQIVNVMLPGDCFDLQALAARYADHTVEAITPMEIHRAPTPAFLKMVHGNGRLAAAFWWTAIQEDSVLREQIVRVGRRSGRERLAHLILELQRRLEMAGAPISDSVPLPLTRDMLGDFLGLSRVHVTRSMGALRRMGLIGNVNGSVHILKQNKLIDLAQFDDDYLHQNQTPA